MRTSVKVITSIALCLLSACAPRGETKTLDDIYQSSKARFSAVQGAAVPAEIGQPLKQVSGRLEELSAQKGSQASQTAGEVAELLAPLITKAGFTARPALGEVVSQYRMMANAAGKDIETPQAKLLAARTYALLASELETTKFSVN